MNRMTSTTLIFLVIAGLCQSAGADERYERRAIPDGASRSRRSNPPPPAVGVHRRQPAPPAVGVHRRPPAPPAIGIGRRKPAPPAVGVYRGQPPPPVIRRQPPPPAVAGRPGIIPDPPHYHTGGGMLIDSVNPQAATVGDIIEIRGERFDSFQGNKIVAINQGRVNSVRVLSWSDNLIRVRIPEYLNAGSCRVLVYYDDSFRTSSNSVELDIRH